MTSEEVSAFEPSERDFYDPTHDFQAELLDRSDTRQTMLTDFPLRPGPDISIKCEKCNAIVSLPGLKDHRNYHQALSLLRFGNEEPKSIDLLLKRRNFVLRKMKSSATKDKPISPEQITRIDNAFEYLKSVMEGNFEELRQIREDVNAQVGGVGLNCSPDCAMAVGIAASSNERWKSYMEDARTFQDCFGEDRKKCFMGLYDGYHGRFAAEIAASELHKLLLNEMIKFDPRTKSVLGSNALGDHDISHYKFERPDTMQSERVVLHDESVNIIQNIINMCEDKYSEMIKKLDNTPENRDKDSKEEIETKKKKRVKTPFELKMEHAFSKAYYLLDILLSYGKDEHSRIRWSGCSATTCIIQDVAPEDTIPEVDIDDMESNISGLSGNLDPPKTVGRIHIANAGDVRAVLVRGNRPYVLTKDHTPNNKKERNRILKDGGNLTDSTKECCVNGVLLTTRGLGNHGDQSLKKCVLVEPYTTSAPIDQYAQFLVIASRGVWEVFNEKEVASLLTKLLPSNQIPPPGKVSSTLQILLDEMHRDPSSDTGSRRMSFPSRDNLVRRKSGEYLMNRRRSGTLESVAESHLERVCSKSDTEEGASDGKQPEVKAEQSMDSQGKKLSVTSSSAEDRQRVSTPSKGDSSDKSMKRLRKYVDADMQTEIGSQHDGNDTDSGNEADVDSYLENVSFPEAISRISMVDGPPSKEQLQRNQAEFMAEHLIQAALLAGAKDNLTAMVVLLPGCGF